MAMIAKHTTTVYQERRCGVINIYHGCRALTLVLARLPCISLCLMSKVRGPTHWWCNGSKSWGIGPLQSPYGCCVYEARNAHHVIVVRTFSFLPYSVQIFH